MLTEIFSEKLETHRLFNVHILFKISAELLIIGILKKIEIFCEITMTLLHMC